MRKGINLQKWILLAGLVIAVVVAYLVFLHPFPEVASRTETFFGMEVSVRARGRRAEVAIASAFIAVERVFHTMSRFREGSDVWRVNTSVPGQMVRVSESTFDLICRSTLISEKTDGAFDITILPLMDLWRSARQQHALPPAEAVEAARARVNWQGILLDADEFTVGLQKAGMGIDLGGIAKGYAVDAAIAALAKYGINEAMVDIGGDLYLLGVPRGEEWWRIGIEDPRRVGVVFAHLYLRDEAVVTSGDYRWYFIIDEQRFHHIINPYTGFPVERMQSVTIVAPNATLADGLSTAVFVLGSEAGIRLVEGLEGVDAVIVSEDADGNRVISISSGLKDQITLLEDPPIAPAPDEEPITEPAHRDYLRAFLVDTGLTFTAAVKDDFSYYALYDDAGLLQGFVLFATEEGWGGPIDLFVQTDLAGTIERVYVWRHEETPIFVMDLDAFLKTFTAHPATAQLIWQEDLHGLTGATVTAEAIIAAVQRVGSLAQTKGLFIPPGGGQE